MRTRPVLPAKPMHTSVQLLDLLAKSQNLESDYAIAKYLSVSRQRISQYRSRRQPLSYALGLKIADATGLDRGYVMACLSFERTDDQKEQAAWMEAARRLQATHYAHLQRRGGAPRRRWTDKLLPPPAARLTRAHARLQARSTKPAPPSLRHAD